VIAVRVRGHDEYKVHWKNAVFNEKVVNQKQNDAASSALWSQHDSTATANMAACACHAGSGGAVAPAMPPAGETARAVIGRRGGAIPVPGLDVVSDLHLFTRLIDDINQASA
jgi:hypothetical protein